jgi:hypothetical protein
MIRIAKRTCLLGLQAHSKAELLEEAFQMRSDLKADASGEATFYQATKLLNKHDLPLSGSYYKEV